jgi:butyrate response factor 1
MNANNNEQDFYHPSTSPSLLSPRSFENEPLDHNVPTEEEQKQNLYKTELCRSFCETGTCRYGHKCQFAHGGHELRPVARHPKYKTEICKTFTSTGNCPYGNRCRFIHQSQRSQDASLKTSPSKSSSDVNNAASTMWTNSWTAGASSTTVGVDNNKMMMNKQQGQQSSSKKIAPPSSFTEAQEQQRRLAFFQGLAN